MTVKSSLFHERTEDLLLVLSPPAFFPISSPELPFLMNLILDYFQCLKLIGP